MRLLIHANSDGSSVDECRRWNKVHTDLSTSIGHNVTVGHGLVLGKACYIGDNVWIGYKVKIGYGVRVGPDAIIEDGVKLGNHCVIHSGIKVPDGVWVRAWTIVTQDDVSKLASGVIRPDFCSVVVDGKRLYGIDADRAMRRSPNQTT